MHCKLKGINLQADESFILADLADKEYFNHVSFDNSNLEKIPKEIFQNFPNLELFFATNVGLKKLDPDFFKGAENMKTLDLSKNKIEELKEAVFGEAPNLQNLILAENAITVVDRSAFKSIPKITILNLDDNKIKELNKDTFQFLEKLKTLSIKNNKLEVIENELFTRNPALEEVELEGNKIESVGPKVFNITGRVDGFTITLINSKCAKGLTFKQSTEVREYFMCSARYSTDNVQSNFDEINAKVLNTEKDLNSAKITFDDKVDSLDSKINELNAKTIELELKINKVDALLAEHENSSSANVTSIAGRLNDTYNQASIGIVSLGGVCVFMLIIILAVCARQKTVVNQLDPEDVVISSKTLEEKGNEVEITMPPCQAVAEYRPPKHRKKPKKSKKRKAKRVTSSESESESEAESASESDSETP